MDFAEQVKSSVDIVSVIGEYVRLRKTGTRYTGLCPFHNEKTPSFSVNPQHQFFKCFGCGEAGDVFAFVMKHDSLSFFEALKLLAERNGIPIPKRPGYADDDAKACAAIYKMHELAEAEFRRQLVSEAGAGAREYLRSRGVGAEAMERFGLGYAPRNGSMAGLLRKEGFSPAEVEESGLAGKREDGSFYDRFRNRLMFPIHNEAGKPIAFGGRALSPEDKAKYVNSPETKIYRKSNVLYNIHRAKDGIRAAGRVVLVEGYMDAIGAFMAGVKEVIASCGTALTSQQVQALRRHSADVVVNFDADAAGENAAERSIQMLLAEGLRVRILTLDGGLDPDEYCRKHGADAYLTQVAQASGYFHWLAARARARHDMHSAEGRYAAFQLLLPAIQTLTDKLERAAVVNDVAGYLGIDKGLVLESFRKMSAGGAQAATRPEPEPMRHRDRILLSVLLSEAGHREEFFGYLKALPSLKTGPAGRIYEALIALYDTGEPLSFNALHGRLPEAEQELLAAALIRNETEGEAPSVDEGLACLEALVEEERGTEKNALKTRVREAERAGNLAEALRLSGELTKLQNRA
jgi:DNA primase